MAEVVRSNVLPCRQRLRLVILEDSPADAELMTATLKQAGHPVTFDIVESPEAFRERLRQNDYDIILADYNLITWTAMDALQILQESANDVPFVVVTGTLGDEAAVECIKRGASEYVLKNRLYRLPLAVERALHEKALRQEAARLQEVVQRGKREWELTFDTIPDAVIVLDDQNHIKRANRAMAELLGSKPAELIGRVCYEMVHGLSEPHPNCPHRRTLQTGKEERSDIEEPRLGKIFDVTTTPLRDPNGGLRGSVHVMRDITERKQLEEQLLQARKMEAIGRLAGGVAHDFNNLLMIVKGYSELLLDRIAPPDPLHRHAAEILKAADRAASLIRQLLAFSRKQVLEPKILNLNAILAETDQMLHRLIREDIELAVVPHPQLGRVKVDPSQIEQVILNLALNARDAMPRGGKLTIESANVELDETYVAQRAHVAPGHYVMLAVSDTGCGMDAETKFHLFEPFFTTKEPGKGTGLGLATVYGIVKQSGGHIWVYSEPGLGTTFKIYLPRVEGEVEEAARPATSQARPLAGTETVLLVEDADGVREVASEFLRMSGYTVLEAADGPAALELVERYPGPIHLLLSDVVMPGMSGRELARQLAALRPAMKVLYVSGYAEEAIVRHGVLDPGTVFLQKPFGWETLTRKVREVLDQASEPTLAPSAESHPAR